MSGGGLRAQRTDRRSDGADGQGCGGVHRAGLQRHDVVRVRRARPDADDHDRDPDRLRRVPADPQGGGALF